MGNAVNVADNQKDQISKAENDELELVHNMFIGGDGNLNEDSLSFEGQTLPNEDGANGLKLSECEEESEHLIINQQLGEGDQVPTNVSEAIDVNNVRSDSGELREEISDNSNQKKLTFKAIAKKLVKKKKKVSMKDFFLKTKEKMRQWKLNMQAKKIGKEKFKEACAGLEKFFELVELTEKDLKSLWKLFMDIDKDHSWTIEINEMFDYLAAPVTPFAIRVFQSFELDEDGVTNPKVNLDFGEYVAGAWNFCTLNHGQLVEFAFDMYDVDQLNCIDIVNLVKMIHGVDVLDNKLVDILHEFDVNNDHTLDFDEFRACEREHRIIIKPAFMLQRLLRSKILNQQFWVDATKIRHVKIGTSGINIMEYFRTLRKGEDVSIIEYSEIKKVGIVISKTCSVFEFPRLSGDPKKSKNVLKQSEFSVKRAKEVLSQPNLELRVLQENEHVDIYEERLDMVFSGIIWYLIDTSGKGWVQHHNIKIDYNWLEKEGKKRAEELIIERAKKKAAAKKAEREGKIKEISEQYEEHVDEASGRYFWYHIETGQSTWKDPYAEIILEGPGTRKEQNRQLEIQKEQEREEILRDERIEVEKSLKDFAVFLQFHPDVGMDHKIKMNKLDPKASLIDLKERILADRNLNMELGNIRLFYQGREQVNLNSRLIVECGILPDSLLHVVVCDSDKQISLDRIAWAQSFD